MHPYNTHPRRQGFTLIELMVTVGIIAILIAILITVIPKVKLQVQITQTNAQLSALANAIQQYHNDFGSYPGPLSNTQIASDYLSLPKPSITVGGTTFTLSGPASNPFTNADYDVRTNLNPGHISGTQNLTLGLLGGLELQIDPATGNVTGFIFNPADITTDGISPAPRGAASLTTNNPRRAQAYIQVNKGDISVPNALYGGGKGASFTIGANGSFADSDGAQSPTDAMIPVFLDKFSQPMPILYFRCNPGAKAIVGYRNADGTYSDDGGATLTDTAASTYYGQTINEQAQYDLYQVKDYVYSTSAAGAIGTNIQNPKADHHGLQGVGNLQTDTIASGWATAGKNGAAYLRDPNYRIDTTNMNNSYDPLATNTHAGVPRQKDAFLLISAGPDHLYGTADDLIYPGSLIVSQ